MFVHGRRFDETFETDLGAIRVVAMVLIERDHLFLQDFAIYPRHSVLRLPVGTRQVVEIVRAIERTARIAGFTRITIEAERVSGANPGRIIRIERRLL